MTSTLPDLALPLKRLPALAPAGLPGIAMPVPRPRGPLSRLIADALNGSDLDTAAALDAAGAPAPAGVLLDEDLQISLFMLYELHYRGLVGVSDEREWDP